MQNLIRQEPGHEDRQAWRDRSIGHGSQHFIVLLDLI